MNKYTRRGHLAALLTVLIWGTTFIATKVLLESFQPVEILFFRFLLATRRCGSSSRIRCAEQRRSRNGSLPALGFAGSVSTIYWKISR